MEIISNNNLLIENENKKIESLTVIKLNEHESIPRLAERILKDPNHEEFDLKKIIIKNCHLHPKEYESIRKIIHSSEHLIDIELYNNDIDIEHTCEILSSLAQSNLQQIIFSENFIGEDDADKFFLNLKSHHYLTILDLSMDWLGDAGSIRLADYLSLLKQPFKLNLSCNDIHYLGVKAILESIQKNPALEEIDLSYNNIDLKQSILLNDVISTNTNLKLLDVRSNDVGDNGVDVIADAIPNNSNLAEINLSDNKITDKGFIKLMKIIKNHYPLKKLNLKHNPISANTAELIKNDLLKNKSQLELIV